VVERVSHFADRRLGKGVVIAKDSPNFIANHLGVYGVAQVLRALESGEYTIEEIDAITGPALGRPKSATFRTMDIAGIDILVHVAKNLNLELPPFVTAMVERGWIGDKAGQGFYKKVKSNSAGGGRSEILTLDPKTMTWGFGWELGPFEIAKAIGASDVARLSDVAPPFQGRVQTSDPDLQLLKSAKDRQKVVRKNAGASLIDLGDGVLSVEFHSKMNSIGADTGQMLLAGVKEAAANFAALVVGNDAPNFSVGANLMLLLLEAQEGNWDEIDLMIRGFQGTTQALRFADVPVVVAPAGMTLGGGCEIAIHGDRIQAAAETYMGQVEVGVGLIPAGGGTKEMLARAVE